MDNIFFPSSRQVNKTRFHLTNKANNFEKTPLRISNEYENDMRETYFTPTSYLFSCFSHVLRKARIRIHI